MHEKVTMQEKEKQFSNSSWIQFERSHVFQVPQKKTLVGCANMLHRRRSRQAPMLIVITLWYSALHTLNSRVLTLRQHKEYEASPSNRITRSFNELVEGAASLHS